MLFTGSRRACTRLSTARAPTRKRPTPRRSTCTCARTPRAPSLRPEPPHARRYAQHSRCSATSARQDLHSFRLVCLVCTGAGAGGAISRERLTAADLGAGTDALAFLGAHFAHDSRPGPRTRQPARIGFASAVAVRHRWNVRPFRVKQLRGCNSRRALTWLVCRQEQRGTNGGGLSARLARRGAVRHQRYPRRQPAAAAAGAGIGHGALPSLRAR